MANDLNSSSIAQADALFEKGMELQKQNPAKRKTILYKIFNLFRSKEIRKLP